MRKDSVTQQNIHGPRLGPRFHQALAFSFELHGKQVRKGTDIPYVSHLLAVASLVLEHGGNEDEAIAALLHDAAEDQGGERTLAEIEARFGAHVSVLVRELSDSIPKQGSEGAEKAPWRQRKEGYLERLATASPSARLISAADKLHNCRSTVADLRRDGACVWERFNTSKEEHLWFYRAFYQTIAEHGSAPIVEALGEAILDLEQATRPGDLAKAIAIAARAHLLQQDKAGAPYVLHPLRLMVTALGESAQIAAVLHDVVEDCKGWSFERLRQEGFPRMSLTRSSP